MAVLSFRTSTYARNIYLYGTYSFQTVPAEYVQPIKQHAAGTFSDGEIDSALASVYITQPEYDDTIAIKYPLAPEPVKGPAAEPTNENAIETAPSK